MFNQLSHLSLKKPLAVIDIETTGVSPKNDRLIEIAVLKLMPQSSCHRFVQRVNPGIPIPVSATAVHGLHDEDVEECPAFESVAARLAKFLKGCDLCGFNVKRFDIPFLVAEFGRAGLRFSLTNRAVIDVMQIFHRKEPRDLAAAARHYLGREHTNGHRAFADAYATVAILDAQLARHSDLPKAVAELHATMTDVDVAGRFRKQEGIVVFNFGKYVGRPLDEIAEIDPDYLWWIMDQEFLDDAKAIVRLALRANCPS
jgi:DNA polymerase-3 subunit epsilon